MSRAGALLRGLPGAAIATVDLAIVQAWRSDGLETVEALLMHMAALTAICGLMMLRAGRPNPAMGLFFVVMALLGPLGGLAVLLGQVVAMLGLETTGRDSAARADPAPNRSEALYALIRQGRRPSYPSGALESFETVFAQGSLADQQSAIATISRNFEPRMMPALRRALAAPVPAVRVQAAAVHAKLRGSFGDRARTLLALSDAPGPSLLPEHGNEARQVAASGFVDAATAARLEAIAARLTAQHETVAPPVPPPDPALEATRPALEQVPSHKRYACGGIA